MVLFPSVSFRPLPFIPTKHKRQEAEAMRTHLHHGKRSAGIGPSVVWKHARHRSRRYGMHELFGIDRYIKAEQTLV